MKTLLGLMPWLFIVGCTSAKLKVQSTPSNAQVYMSLQSSKNKVLIGATPLEISYSDLQGKLGSTQSGGEYFVMYVEAKDNESERLLIPPNSFGVSTVNVNLNLTAKQEVKNAGMILQRLHNAQKFAMLGQLESAQIECDKALEVDPFFVRSISMKGSLFYMQKKYDEAMVWYEKALSVDSSFQEAIKMIARIKQERTK